MDSATLFVGDCKKSEPMTELSSEGEKRIIATQKMASTTLHIDDGESTEITITIPYERGHALLSLYKEFDLSTEEFALTFEDRVLHMSLSWATFPEFQSTQNSIETSKLLQWLHKQTLSFVLNGLYAKVAKTTITHLSNNIERAVKDIKQPTGLNLNMLIKLVSDPWGEPVIQDILNCKPVVDSEAMKFFVSEEGYITTRRLEMLCKAKCEDLAARLMKQILACLHFTNSPFHVVCNSEDINYFIDLYISLIYKKTQNSHLPTEMKYVSFEDGLQTVYRLISRKHSKSRMFRHSSDLAEFASNIFLTYAMICPVDEQTDSTLTDLMKVWAKLHEKYIATNNTFSQKLQCIIDQAESAKHIYMFTEVLNSQFGNQLKQLYVELYIKAITTELNTAIIAEEDQGVSRINAGLSKSYLKFANLVYEYKEIRRECIITAFSLNPTVECLELLKNSANANKAEGEEHNINRENSKVNELPTCDLHPPYIISNKSHGELCSQCGEFTGMKKKRLKRMQEGVVDGQDVIEEETESETESGDPYTYFIKVLEPLQLTKDLCHDFISILQNPRDKSFKVIADGTELESICNEYLNYKRTILKELKYLTIDYKVFDGIPRQEEGTGIEKGYEDFLDSTDSSCKRVHKDDIPPVSKRGKPKAKEKRIVKATKMKENEDQYYQWSDSSEHSVSNSDATYIPHSKDISTLDSDYSSGNTKKSKKISISRNHSNLGSIDLNIQSNINFQNEREINLSTPELTPDSDILHSDLSHISPSYTPVEETYPIENTNFNTEELSGEPQFNECVREPKFDDPEEVSELDEVAREFHGHFLAPMFYSPDLIPSTDTGLSNSIVDLTALDDSVASSPNPSYSPDNTQSTDIEGFTHSSMKANNLEDPCKSLPALVKYGNSDKIVENVSHKNGSCDEFNNHILKLSNSKCISLKAINTNKETFGGALGNSNIKEKDLNFKNKVLDPFGNPNDSLNNKNSPKYSKIDLPDDILDNTVLSNSYNSSAEGIQTDTGEYNIEHFSHNSPVEITVIDNFNVGTSFDCDSALDETDIDGDYNNQHYMLNVTNVEVEGYTSENLKLIAKMSTPYVRINKYLDLSKLEMTNINSQKCFEDKNSQLKDSCQCHLNDNNFKTLICPYVETCKSKAKRILEDSTTDDQVSHVPMHTHKKPRRSSRIRCRSSEDVSYLETIVKKKKIPGSKKRCFSTKASSFDASHKNKKIIYCGISKTINFGIQRDSSIKINKDAREETNFHNSISDSERLNSYQIRRKSARIKLKRCKYPLSIMKAHVTGKRCISCNSENQRKIKQIDKQKVSLKKYKSNFLDVSQNTCLNSAEEREVSSDTYKTKGLDNFGNSNVDCISSTRLLRSQVKENEIPPSKRPRNASALNSLRMFRHQNSKKKNGTVKNVISPIYKNGTLSEQTINSPDSYQHNLSVIFNKSEDKIVVSQKLASKNFGIECPHSGKVKGIKCTICSESSIESEILSKSIPGLNSLDMIVPAPPESTVNIVQLTVPSNANTQNSQISSNSNSGSPQTSEVNSPSQVALCSEDKSTSQSNSTIPVDSTQFAQSSTSEDFERLSSSTMSQNISQVNTLSISKINFQQDTKYLTPRGDATDILQSTLTGSTQSQTISNVPTLLTSMVCMTKPKQIGHGEVKYLTQTSEVNEILRSTLACNSTILETVTATSQVTAFDVQSHFSKLNTPPKDKHSVSCPNLTGSEHDTLIRTNIEKINNIPIVTVKESNSQSPTCVISHSHQGTSFVSFPVVKSANLNAVGGIISSTNTNISKNESESQIIKQIKNDGGNVHTKPIFSRIESRSNNSVHENIPTTEPESSYSSASSKLHKDPSINDTHCNMVKESDKSLRNKISNQIASLPKFQHAFRKTVYQGNTSSIGESSDTLGTSQEIPDIRSKFIENKSQSVNISPVVKTEPQNITTIPSTVLSKAVQTGICNIVSQASSSNAAIVSTGTHPNIHPSTSLGVVQKRILNSAKETNDLSLEVIESTSNVCGITSNPNSLKNSSSSQSGNVLTSGSSLAVQGETFLTHTVKISSSSCSTNLTTTQSESAPEAMMDKSTDDEPSPTTSKSITPKSTVKKICLQIVQRGNIQPPVQSGQNKKSSNDVSGCSIISQTNVPILQNTAGETNGTLRQQLVQSVLVSCLSSSSTNGSGDGNLSQNANPSDTLIAQSPLEPTVSSTTLEQLREFESVLEQVTNTSQMKERGSNCQQPHTRSQTILSPQLLITQQPSSNVHSNFISSDVPTSFSQNLFSAASTSSVSSASIPSSPSRVHVAYVSQSQTVRSNNIPSSNARISSTPVVVVTSYCQPVASPALSVTSQSSSSPCVTPAPIPSSSGTKSSKAKSSKSKSGKTSTSTATSRPSPVPRPQQKPQEDEQTAQRIYAILDEYAEQLRNSPDLKNKPAPRRRSNPPTNPNHSSKRKKSAQTKVKLLGQQSSSTAPEMSPGADDPRTFGSEDSSSGVTQLSHIQNSPAPSTQSADEMGSLRENSSLDASIEAGNLKSVVSDVGDVQGNCQPHRLIFTDANAMQGRAVILQDSVQTISDVTATSSNTSVKPVMMSNTATAVYVPSGLRQVFLPMAPGLTASVQGRPVVVSKGSKVIRVHQVTVPTSLQMSSGTSAVQGAALVVRQMCVKPSVSVATSVSVLNQTTVKQVKLPVGSISSQALSGVSAQPPVVLQPGNHQLAGPIASGETALPHTISFSEPTTQVTKSNVQTDFSRRDKASLVALDGGVSRSSMLGLIHRGMPVTFQDQLTIPIGETATSLSIHSHDRVVLPNIARTSPSSINDVIVTKKYGTKNVTSDTQHKKSWDCIVTVDDKVSTIQTNVAQKSNQQPEDNLSRKALQSSDLNFCSNAMEYSSPNRETSLIDVEYPMQNGSNEITVSISKTKIGDASSLETVKQSPLESKKSCTVTRQLPKYSPKSVLKSDDNVSSDLIGLICNTPLKHDQAQFEKDDTSNHHTSQSDQRSSNTDGIFGNPNERSLCTSPFTSKMPGTLVSHDELASEENLFSSVNSSVPASVTVRSPCAFDKFPKNIGQIMDQQIENFRHNSNNNSNSNSSSSDSILRCVAPDNGGSTIVSQGEGLGNPNQSKVGLLCKSSMSTLDCGNEIGYNMRPRVQQLGYANVSSYHLPTKMTLHKGGHWRYVPIVKKVKMPFRTVILQKDSEDAVMMMGHPSSSVNLTDSTSEVEDSSQENRTYLPDGKDSVVRKHNADHSLLSYHKLESSQQFEKSNDLLAMQQKARVERELRLQKSLSEECEDLGVDEPSTSDLFPEADLLLDTNSSPSFDQTLQDASCSQSLESAEHYPNANFKPLEYSSSSQESEQESHLKRQVKLDSKIQNETKHTAYKLNDELSEWQFETSKELKNKTIGESTREKKSKYRGNILKRRSLDVDTKAVPMKRALIGSTNEKPNDSHSHGMNEHLKISCNSTRTEIVSEKLANKTTRSINDTQSLSSNNAVTVASPGESSFSSSSDDSVTLLDSYTDNVVPLDVTVPICSSLPSQSNNISESKDLLPSVTQSVYTYSRIAGKGSKFIKGKDLKCTNQYLVNHLDSQELWDTSSSQERTVVDDEDSESLSRTEDLTSSPPDQSNSDVEIVELSNDSSHFSCVSYSHIPLMKLVVPRLEEILGVNNRSNGLDHIDNTTANCVGDVTANKIHGTRNFFLNRSNIESQLKSSIQNFENKNTLLGRSSKRKLNIEEESLNHGKRPKTDHSIFSQSSAQKEDDVTVSNIISSNRRIPAASCETSVQSRSQVAGSGCSGEGPCVVQMSSSRLLRRSSLRGHVKRGCSCCNGSPEKPKMKKNVSKVEKSYKKLRTNISKRR